MAQTPPFVLLMPSFNQAHYIGDAVRSVLAQDDPDWQLWIVDNSTDDTPRVMAEFAGDPRVHFHHIPQRMDPGSCLNWMLERVQGRDFSYVHTDNNLAPDYVRLMRLALADDPLSLAYCDMRVIDDAGRRIQVSRRGPFSLAKLLSLRPLGVPFAATLELARRIGGFSAKDVADDVRFCTLAYGLGRFVHVPDPILDYRVHGASRTADIGGTSGMDRAFLRTHAGLLPELEARGLRPLATMAAAIQRVLDDLALLMEDTWYRYFERHGATWHGGSLDLDGFYRAGLVRLPCEHAGGRRWLEAERRAALYRGNATTWVHRLRWRIKLDSELRHRGSEFRDLVVPWAHLTLGSPAEPVTFRAASDDARTLWGAALLEANLGWRRDDGAAAAPALDLRAQPRLGGG